MSGIAGYKYSKSSNPSVLKKMTDALYHRGPDSEGNYQTTGYSAGMRRLAVIDLETGDQPLFNEDRSVVLFYDGVIYNSPQLRRELESKGFRFSTRSDGEVICHLYSEYGADLFEKLDGMFAVALWIETEKKLILARDTLGGKPLYYSRLSETEVAFASEIKSLVKFPGIDLSLNYQALWDFPTFLWIPEPETVYTSISALPPGCVLVADNNDIIIRPYSNRFERDDINIDMTDEEVINETRRVVTEGVYICLLSDVPIGSFLSGGLDSSIIATLAAKKLPRFKTFTIGFADIEDPYHGRANEAAYAEHYAKHIGSEHNTIQITADDFRRDLHTFCKYGDQPFSVSSGLGIMASARMARELGIKVILSGDGADEFFGGYSWYIHLKNEEGCVNTPCDNDSDVSFQNLGMSLEKLLALLHSYPPQKRAWAWHYYASESEKRKLYNPECFDSVYTSLQHFYTFKQDDDWTAEDFINQDRKFYFLNEMLRKSDRMTMAYSVEGRVPFATPVVLDHSYKLKYSHLIRENSLKWVLKKAFADILPAEILSRPKHGFNVPIDHWLKNEWSDLVEESFSQNSALIKLGLIHNGSHNYALDMLHDKTRLNGHTIFSFIMLNLWLVEQFHGNHS